MEDANTAFRQKELAEFQSKADAIGAKISATLQSLMENELPEFDRLRVEIHNRFRDMGDLGNDALRSLYIFDGQQHWKQRHIQALVDRGLEEGAPAHGLQLVMLKLPSMRRRRPF